MIVVVGESLIDIVLSPAAEPVEAVGGGPLNIAVGLARLEQPSLLITQLGQDPHARTVADHLHANEVELVASPTSTGRTATATATVDSSGAARYDFDLEWTLPHQELPGCDALHVGSLGSALEPGCDSVLDLVDQAWGRGVFISYDPNLRPQFVGDPEQAWGDVQAIADRATLVKLSSDDVALLHPDADPADIARALLAGDHTELVVITHGGDGAAGYTDTSQVWVHPPGTDVVDTVGAGDSFMAALLTLLVEDGALASYGAGLPVDEPGLRRLLGGAASAAAVTCSRRGADPPQRQDLPDAWPD